MLSDYSFIPDLCLSLPGAVEEYKESWDAVPGLTFLGMGSQLDG